MDKLTVARVDMCDMINNPGDDGVAISIWFSGCSRQCPGCQNEKLWNSAAGKQFTPKELVSYIKTQMASETYKNAKYSTLVLIGGEPLEQPYELLNDFLDLVSQELLIKIWLYTGYDMVQNGIYPINRVLEKCDIIKDGKYIEALATGGFPASSNQKVYKNARSVRKLIDITDAYSHKEGQYET